MTALPHDPLWPRLGSWPAAGTGAEPADLVVVGVPTHRTSISATSADRTPAAIRAALARYSGSFRADDGAWLDLTELRIADAGDVADPDAGLDEEGAVRSVRALAAAHGVVVGLGGDNAATVPLARGAWGERIGSAGLVTLDAHHDLRDGVSNGSPVRRLVEAGLDPRRVVQVGIADFANSPAYARRAREWGVTVVPRAAIEERPLAEIVTSALAVAGSGGGPIHVDVDVDVCDRSVAPACPASAPGGISAFQLLRLVRLLARDPRVRSLDVVEIDAARDAPDERTVRLGARVVLEAAAGVVERAGSSTPSFVPPASEV